MNARNRSPGWLLTALPDDVKVIGDALARNTRSRPGLENLRRMPLDESAEPAARLRAACVLARLEPARAGRSARWRRRWPKRFWRSTRARSRGGSICWAMPSSLLIPALSEICRDRDRDGDGAGDRGRSRGGSFSTGKTSRATLADAHRDATPEASHVLLRELLSFGSDPTSRLDTLRKVLDERPDDPDDEAGKDALASRQASAAIALAALGRARARCGPCCGIEAIPDFAPFLIERLAVSTLTMPILVDRLSQPDIDPIERQAILLAWAEMPQAALTKPFRDAVVARARDLYLGDPDPGVHSAAELLLRRWDEPELLERLSASLEKAASGKSGLRWVAGPNGHTFRDPARPARIPDGIAAGKRRILRLTGLALSQDRSVDHGRHQGGDARAIPEIPACAHATSDVTATRRRRAATRISWFDAAAYCNWLSETAGIPKSEWCYPEYPGPGMTISEDSVKRTGFRLANGSRVGVFLPGRHRDVAAIRRISRSSCLDTRGPG